MTTSTTLTPTFRRKEYTDRKCSHREYYAQFVNERVKKLLSPLKPMILRSTDPHLNDIPLPLWDRLTDATRDSIDRKLWKAAEAPKLPEGSYSWSLCANTCILKEAAKQIQETHRAALS